MPDKVSPLPHSWVDTNRGVVSRDIFVSDDIYRLELESNFRPDVDVPGA